MYWQVFYRLDGKIDAIHWEHTILHHQTDPPGLARIRKKQVKRRIGYRGNLLMNSLIIFCRSSWPGFAAVSVVPGRGWFNGCEG
jgi:hypothetical protein